MKYDFNSGDMEIKRNGLFVFNYFRILSKLKYILLVVILVASTEDIDAQNYITIRDTIFYSVDSFDVIENQVDTSNSYTKNIFFHLMEKYEENNDPNSRVIPNFCEIPVDFGCQGCDFEDTSKITTEYWAASVETFNTDSNQINILNNELYCAPADYPIKPNEQCNCSNSIQTPVYYCSENTNQFLNFDFFDDCGDSSNVSSSSNSEELNHFRLTGYGEMYGLLNISNPCIEFAEHFGQNVLRLGDDYTDFKLATLIKRIVVDSTFLNFDFALILENPQDHSTIEKPSFRVNIYNNKREDLTHDSLGNSRVNLGWNNNEIPANHPELEIPSDTNLRYLDWSCGIIDLSDSSVFAIGDTLYLLFEQRDCGQGAHWSKVYIDNIGGGMCNSIADGSVNYNSELSYTCNDTIVLAFNYELPVLNIDTQNIVGNLEITLRLSGTDSIPSGIITSSNGLSGTHIFKIPVSLLSDYVNATFTYSTTSSIGCYNLVPVRFDQRINLPTANICNPQCALFSDLNPNTTVSNTYLLDDNFMVKTVDSSGIIYNIKQGEGFKVYTGGGITNGCLDSKTVTGSAISDIDKKNNLLFLFKEPVESFSLRIIDYDGKKFADATIYKIFLKAYDSAGVLLDVDSLGVLSGGDFCTAPSSSKYTATKHSANYTFYNSGLKIKKVELSFYNNTATSGKSDYPVDLNMAISDMCYVPCWKPEIMFDEFTCAEDTIRLSVVNFRTDKSYSWTGPNGFTADTSHVTIPNASPSHNGTYILSSYSPNCGIMYDTVVVNIGNQSVKLLGPDVVLCAGQSKTLNATVSGATYLWKGGATTSTITVDTSGVFWVAVSKDGCTKYDTIKVTFIGDPALESIPYKTRHNCINDDSGILQLLWDQKTGGVLTEGTAPKTETYIDDLRYDLYIDDIRNNTFDALCSRYLKSGTLSAGWRDSLFITGLDLGDYKIVLKPNTICRKVTEGGITTDSICMLYSQCYNDSIEFTFTIRKHIYPSPLGDDKILCPAGMVSIQVPSTYYDALVPESIKWGSVCGIYDSQYNISTLIASSIVTDTLRDALINGRGGVHTVEIVTQDGCIIRDTIVVADLQPLIIPDSMPSALATNAVNYSSFWSTQYNNIKWQDAEIVEIFENANIFHNGQAGIYRPNKNHDYLDSLNTTIGFTSSYENGEPSTQLRDINIRSTGNIMPYKLFNYGNPLFVDCIPQWIHNSTMTKYSPSGFDIENKDIMGIYSSALYGYNDMLPIAVASNAKNDEIGFESFEEYSKDDIEAVNYYDSLTQLNNSTGNIDLVKQTDSLWMPKSREYEIVRAFNRYAMIKGNICTACDDPFSVYVNAQTVPIDIRTEKIKNHGFTSARTRIMASPCGDSTYTILQLDKGTASEIENALKCRFWVGNLKVTEKRFVPLIENIGFELDETKAHTGNYSLKVPKDEQIYLPQVELELKPRQIYHFGAWVHSASMETLSPSNLKNRHMADSIGVFIKLPNNEVIFIQPSGEVINGWQKIEGTFTMPAGSRTQIQLGFQSQEEFNIDDIRIYPQNSAIQTYVYDPNNYKVRAVLDQNNYATVYHYDDEGNLFAIKKETIKGIKTIQVSSSHLKSER